MIDAPSVKGFQPGTFAAQARLEAPVLDVRDLQVQYPTREGIVTALDGLSMQVKAGEIVGLVGESGCGKSTAALSFMRLLPKPGRIAAGSITLDGRDILKLSEREMRGLRGPSVAMIFQDALTALDPTMPVGKQIAEPLRLHKGLSGGAARARAIELLGQVGIPDPERRFGQYSHEFSGGMRQRAMIAVALSCGPRLLIADEPTTALDVTVQRQILRLIRELRDTSGAAVVYITHDVGVVAELCARVIVMYAGRAVETGPTQRVFTAPAHPYTAGLLGSTLELTGDRSLPLNAIPGLPPELIDLPAGCAFAPRCPLAVRQCQEARPALEAAGDGHAVDHQVACWLREA
ncbi:MAG: ABC transporter ATP-binding protein [Anaerolineae bacterium]|nr:ABC transporter ATP-binding protein [Anaerolineae bacterium]